MKYLIIFSLLLTGCGVKKGYEGEQVDHNALAKIKTMKYREETHKAPNQEDYLLHKVDEKVVGDYWKAYPSYVDVLPGERIITVIYQSDFNQIAPQKINVGAVAANVIIGGAIGGVISGAIANSSSYEDKIAKISINLTIPVEAGHHYQIMFYPRSISKEEALPQPWVVDITDRNKIVYGEVPSDVDDPLLTGIVNVEYRCQKSRCRAIETNQ